MLHPVSSRLSGLRSGPSVRPLIISLWFSLWPLCPYQLRLFPPCFCLIVISPSVAAVHILRSPPSPICLWAAVTSCISRWIPGGGALRGRFSPWLGVAELCRAPHTFPGSNTSPSPPPASWTYSLVPDPGLSPIPPSAGSLFILLSSTYSSPLFSVLPYPTLLTM